MKTEKYKCNSNLNPSQLRADTSSSLSYSSTLLAGRTNI